MNRISEERLAKGIQNLPSLSDTVMEVLHLLNHAEPDVSRIEASLAQDPVLVARILRVANSPFYGIAGQIRSLREACMVLGLSTIRNIVTTASIVNALSVSAAAHNECDQLWQHAVQTAAAAKVLADEVRADGESAFTVGLLHDIGKLVLATHLPDLYAEVQQYRTKHDCFPLEAEKAVLGMNHAAIGAQVFKHWRLPDDLAEVVARHHSTDEADVPLLADVVHVADVLARGLDTGGGSENLVPPLVRDSFERLGIGWDRISGLLMEIENLQEEAAAVVP